MAISQRLENAALNLLKANVGNLKPSKEIEEYMTSCVLTAAANLADAKIALSDELPDDAHLLAMYAATAPPVPPSRRCFAAACAIGR